jgi:transposase
MTIIGFDISKNELVGVRINKTSHLQESYAIENTRSAITDFLDALTERSHKILVASEATAEYHRTLALECLTRNIPFRLLNPITTKQFTHATVRKKKTDLSDALVIAKRALQGEGTLLTEESFSTFASVSVRYIYRVASLSSSTRRRESL